VDEGRDDFGVLGGEVVVFVEVVVEVVELEKGWFEESFVGEFAFKLFQGGFPGEVFAGSIAVVEIGAAAGAEAEFPVVLTYGVGAYGLHDEGLALPFLAGIGEGVGEADGVGELLVCVLSSREFGEGGGEIAESDQGGGSRSGLDSFGPMSNERDSQPTFVDREFVASVGAAGIVALLFE